MPRSPKRRHRRKLVCHFLENSWSSSSPGSALLVSLCGRWLCASPSNTACPFCLLYLVWLVSSHYCSFVFGRASRASMETGRRAACAQPGHLAAQRGRGRGGRWSRGSGSAGKRDIFPPLFLSSFSFFSQAFCSLIHSFLPPSSYFHTLSVSPMDTDRVTV